MKTIFSPFSLLLTVTLLLFTLSSFFSTVSSSSFLQQKKKQQHQPKQSQTVWNQVQYKAGNESEAAPTPVMSMASALVFDKDLDEDVLILFGGCTSSCCFAPISDTYLYQVQSNLWLKLALADEPSPRFGMVSVNFGNDLLMFGGSDVSQGFLNELWLFEYSTKTWSQLLLEEKTEFDEEEEKIDTMIPVRNGAGGFILNDQYLVIYGGINSLTGVLNDMYLIDLTNYKEAKKQPQSLNSHNNIPNDDISNGNTNNKNSSGNNNNDFSMSSANIDHSEMQKQNEKKAERVGINKDVKASSLSWIKLEPVSSECGNPPPFLSQMVIIPSFVDSQSALITTGTNELGEDTNTSYLITIDVDANTVNWKTLVPSPGETSFMVRHGASALYSVSSSTSTASSALGSIVEKNERKMHYTANFQGDVLDDGVITVGGLFGGVNTTADTLPSSFLRDAYRINSTSIIWESDPTTMPQNLTARAYSSVTHGDGYTLVFGGFSGYTGGTDDKLLNDMWIYHY